MMRHVIRSLFLGMALMLTATGPEAQQNPFAPAVLVNGKVITNFDIDQRVRLLQLFRTPGD
ncbi:MAG: peptidylprolyl isomerase, partial [Pseudomonadota bacterium]